MERKKWSSLVGVGDPAQKGSVSVRNALPTNSSDPIGSHTTKPTNNNTNNNIGVMMSGSSARGVCVCRNLGCEDLLPRV